MQAKTLLTILTVLLTLLMFVVMPLYAAGSLFAYGLSALFGLALIAGASVMSRNFAAFLILSVVFALAPFGNFMWRSGYTYKQSCPRR